MNQPQMNKFLAGESMTMVEAMQKIDQNAKGILFIVSQNNQLLGTVTDGDIRRAIIRTGNLKLKILDIMNRSPKAVLPSENLKPKELFKEYGVHAVAVVDVSGTLVNIVFDQDNGEEILTGSQGGLDGVPVVIMAGGQGTRLYPFTKILPKPLIPIGDVPMIDRIIDKFYRYGASQFFVSVNYKKNMIKSYLAEKAHLAIQYIEEEKPLGTAGSLRIAMDDLKKAFFVTNCDILIQEDYSKIYQYHVKEKNLLTVISALKNIEIPYGVIQAKENGNVFALEEKPKLSYLINTGMYVLDPECLQWIPKDKFFHMTQLINMILQNQGKIGMYPISGHSFLDMGEWEQLQRMEQKLKQSTDEK